MQMLDHLILQGGLALSVSHFDDISPIPSDVLPVALSVVVFLGFKFLDVLVTSEFIWHTVFRFSKLKPQGRLLTDDRLNWYDHVFVTVNRCVITVFYVLHTLRYFRGSSFSPLGLSGGERISWKILPTLPVIFASFVQCIVLYGMYDLVYVPFHRTLHIPKLYPWIHKHHHRQLSPYRVRFHFQLYGAYDGINTNPLEFLFGEYLHLFVVIVLDRLLLLFKEYHDYGGFIQPVVFSLLQVQGLGLLLFFSTTSLMASLNHTRLGVKIPFMFDVRDHDVHHRWPRTNYGQFVMWWDHLSGTHKPYAENFTTLKKENFVKAKFS